MKTNLNNVSYLGNMSFENFVWSAEYTNDNQSITDVIVDYCKENNIPVRGNIEIAELQTQIKFNNIWYKVDYFCFENKVTFLPCFQEPSRKQN